MRNPTRATTPPTVRLLAATILLPLTASPGQAQSTTSDPFPTASMQGDAVVVDVADFATLPVSDGEPARMMRLVDEPVTGRLRGASRASPSIPTSPGRAPTAGSSC